MKEAFDSNSQINRSDQTGVDSTAGIMVACDEQSVLVRHFGVL